MKKTKVTYLENGLFIEETHCIRVVKFEEILFLSFDLPYVRINLLNKTTILLFMSMYEVSQKLPQKFLLCNQSCIVNFEHAVELGLYKSKYTLKLIDETVVCIPRRKIRLVKERFIQIKQT